MLRRKGVAHYSTENENIKAGMVERFIRTLREVMSRLIEHRDSNRYVDVLDKLVDGYMEMMCRDCVYRKMKGRH